jgi:uncharacterized protein YegP (UPF0339 family)
MHDATFYILKDRVTHQYSYVLKTSAQEIVLRGKLFDNKQLCNDAIVLTKIYAHATRRYQRIDNSSSYRFTMKSPKGAIIGFSEKYCSLFERDKCIKKVVNEAPFALVVDLS